VEWDSSQTCATVGQFISSIILKELLAGQLQQGRVPDPVGAQMLLQQLAPSIAEDLLETSLSWIPVAAEVSSETLLPDLDRFPIVSQSVEGLTVHQRKLLLEAIEIILDVFNEPEAQGQDPETFKPSLPRPSMACIAAQVAMMLEHLTVLRRGQGRLSAAGGHLDGGDLDLAVLHQVHAAAGKPVRGSREDLMEEVQQCRKRIFEQQKELEAQAKAAGAGAARAKREHAQKASRMMSAFENQTKKQTEELKAQVSDLVQRVTHEQWRAEQKAQQAKFLEEELAKQARMQDDMLVREKEYGKRILDLHLKEYESTARHDQRIKVMSKVMQEDGSQVTRASTRKVEEGDNPPELTEAAIAELAKRTLEDLQQNFDGIFDKRLTHFKDSVKKSEARLAERQHRVQAVLDQTKKDVLVAHERVQHPQAYAKGGHARRADAGCQTEPLWGEVGLSPTDFASPRRPRTHTRDSQRMGKTDSVCSQRSTGPRSRLSSLLAAGPMHGGPHGPLAPMTTIPSADGGRVGASRSRKRRPESPHEASSKAGGNVSFGLAMTRASTCRE